MASIQDAAERQDFRMLFVTAIITSMVFVVGLFWNDAMRSFIESFLPASEAVSAKFAAALIVTTIVGFAVFLFYRSMRFAEYAKKGITNQTMKILKDFDKRKKEMERKRAQLDRALERASKNL